MRIRPHFNHWVPKKLNVQAIVLYPYVLFAKQRAQVDPVIIQHEMIHVRQVRARGWIRFYLSYLGQYCRLRLQGRSHSESYLGISFEKEAYQGQQNERLTQSEREEWESWA